MAYLIYEATTGHGLETTRVRVRLELVHSEPGQGTYRSTLNRYLVRDCANARPLGYVWKQESPSTRADGRGWRYEWGSGLLAEPFRDPAPARTRDKALENLLRKVTGYVWTVKSRHTKRKPST